MRADGIGKTGCRLLGVSAAGLRIHPPARKVDGGILKIRRMHNNCHPYYAGAAARSSHKYAFVVDNGGVAGQGIASGDGSGTSTDPRQVAAVELLQVRPAAAATTAGECVDRSRARAEVGSTRGVVAELTGGYGDSAEEAASLFMATSGGGGGGRSSWQAAHPAAPVNIIPTGGHNQLHAAAGGVSCSRGGGSATAVTTALHGILGGGDHHQPSTTTGVNAAAASGDRFVCVSSPDMSMYTSSSDNISLQTILTFSIKMRPVLMTELILGKVATLNSTENNFRV
jgi:hypothetical protein